MVVSDIGLSNSRCLILQNSLSILRIDNNFLMSYASLRLTSNNLVFGFFFVLGIVLWNSFDVFFICNIDISIHFIASETCKNFCLGNC